MTKSIFLKNMSRINEEEFKVSKRPELFDKYLKSDYGDKAKSLDAYVVYTDNASLVVGYCFNRQSDGSIKSFKEELESFIRLYDPKEYKDFLFFLDAYPRYHYRTPSIKELFKWQYQECDPVDTLLAESRGFLLWTYQFDNLLRFFGNNEWERIRKFAIDNYLLNSKPQKASREQLLATLEAGFRLRKYYRDFMKTLKFTDKISMYDVMDERQITKNIHNPNIREAYVLYETLKGGV